MSKHSREAKAFARTAKVGRTYYAKAIHHLSEGKTTLLTEIVFNRKHPLDGTPCRGASYTAEGAYLRDGPLYEDRDHHEIRDIPTLREYEEFKEKYGEEFLNGHNPEGRRFRAHMSRSGRRAGTFYQGR